MNIFVGNLNYQTTEKQLHGLFSEFGIVKSVNIVIDKFSNRSRGFGFVEMEEHASAEKAIERLNNTTFDSMSIVVNEARPRTERREGFGDRGGNRYSDRNGNRNSSDRNNRRY